MPSSSWVEAAAEFGQPGHVKQFSQGAVGARSIETDCSGVADGLAFSSNGGLAICHLAGLIEIAGNHFLDHLGKERFRLPAELLVRLAGIADRKSSSVGLLH
jgi:hypothetical protein